MNPNLLDVYIRNREGVLLDGPCKSVTSYNKVGKFDLLGKHANFITLIEKEINVVTDSGEIKNFPVDNGVCKVRENKVTIFLGIKQNLTAETKTSANAPTPAV